MVLLDIVCVEISQGYKGLSVLEEKVRVLGFAENARVQVNIDMEEEMRKQTTE